MIDPAEAPTVALVVPVRNEADHIDACLEALSRQTYPRDRLTILVVDGQSDDDTRERVARWSERDARIGVRENPDRIMAVGLNIGIEASHSDIVGVIAGHSRVAGDYVERAVAALRRTEAWSVGGKVTRTAVTPVQRAIGRAASSPVGVGDSTYNYSSRAGWTDTAYPGMWPRWVFERIGLFDPAMLSNEDNELSTRILAAGGGIWYEPSIEVEHVARPTLSGAFHQYRRYARGKLAVFRKHRGALRPRHVVPPIWLAWLVGTAVAGVVVPAAWVALGASLAIYVAVLTAAASHRRRPGDPVLLTVVAFAAIHLGYGIGMWQSLLGQRP